MFALIINVLILIKLSIGTSLMKQDTALEAKPDVSLFTNKTIYLSENVNLSSCTTLMTPLEDNCNTQSYGIRLAYG